MRRGARGGGGVDLRIILCDRLTTDGPASGSLIADLETQLRERDHEVEQVVLPFQDDFAAIASQMMAFRLIQLTDWCAHIIVLGEPLHVLNHPSKTIWSVNPPIGGGLGGRGRPAWWSFADELGFGEATRIYASTDAKVEDLRRRGISAEVLAEPGVMPTDACEDPVSPWTDALAKLLP